MIKAVFFDLYETLITEWDGNKKKATYSLDELGLDKDTYKKEWALRVDQRMDGTFPDHQSALRDILAAQGKEVDESVIEEIHRRRVYAKSIPFKKIDDVIIKTLLSLRKMNIKVAS